MLSVPPGVGIFLFVPPADLSKSYDGLAGLAQEHLKKNVLDGGLFVFFNPAICHDILEFSARVLAISDGVRPRNRTRRRWGLIGESQ